MAVTMQQVKQSTSHQNESTMLTRDDIDEMFLELARYVGLAKWLRENPRTDDDDVWLIELRDVRGFTKQHVEAGVRRFVTMARGNDKREVWAPNLIEFCEYCYLTPAEMNIPPVEVAYADAVGRKWDRHPIAYLVSAILSRPFGRRGRRKDVKKPEGYIEWRNHSEAETFKRFERVYNKLVDKARHGMPLVLPGRIHKQLALENQSKQESEVSLPATRDEHMKNTKLILKCSKGWQKPVEQPAKGE